jgi:hypothetical protein
MRPVSLMLTGGFLTFAAAYVLPLATDPTLHNAVWTLAITAALMGVEGWRRTRTWNPGDYA